jgi:aminomethyltransferase
MSPGPASLLKSPDAGTTLRRTPLHALHQELGAKFVPFAGYDMPLQYADGIIQEHRHVRASAGLFDVSHMGQARLRGPNFEAVAAALEALVPGAIAALAPGRMRYTQLLNENGGIIDDLMVTQDRDGTLVLVVNASEREKDFAHIAAHLPAGIELIREPDRALLALQGPLAATVLAGLAPGSERLAFLSSAAFRVGSIDAVISRSGYTGEDGFEISVAARDAETLARTLLATKEVRPAGLGARDTLRLEAGLCLYGREIDEATTPVEAALSFSIGTGRRAAGNFPGAARILRELGEGPARLRIGLSLEGRAAARSGMTIAAKDGRAIGAITSGAYTPSAAASIAMGYVAAPFAHAGTEVAVLLRDVPVPARVVPLPFVEHRYSR